MVIFMNYTEFEKRKQDHIELALMPANQANERQFLDDVTLVHEAIPDIDFDDIAITTKRFGQAVATPFIVSSMTAGHQNAAEINTRLMSACAEKSWAMGVGSQRRELSDAKAAADAIFRMCNYLAILGLRKLSERQLLIFNVLLTQYRQQP